MNPEARELPGWRLLAVYCTESGDANAESMSAQGFDFTPRKGELPAEPEGTFQPFAQHTLSNKWLFSVCVAECSQCFTIRRRT